MSRGWKNDQLLKVNMFQERNGQLSWMLLWEIEKDVYWKLFVVSGCMAVIDDLDKSSYSGVMGPIEV